MIIRPKMNLKGETIVEVLISIALVSITIVTTYVVGVNASHEIQSAFEKQNAISLAKKQIDLITSYSGMSSNTQCLNINTSSGNIYIPNSCDFNIGNVTYTASISSVKSLSNEYKINISWKGSTGSSNLTMYYIKKT